MNLQTYAARFQELTLKGFHKVLLGVIRERNETIAQLYDELDETKAMLANYKEALADANTHIDFLNASHESAREVGARLLETNERLNDTTR